MSKWMTTTDRLSTNSTDLIASWNSSDFNSTSPLVPPIAPSVEKVYWALLMIPLPLVAVVGNILVILSVYKEKTLQTTTNYFIVSLALADLLVAAVVMPFAVYVLVNVNWELSETLCDFYIALDVTCSTASIFNLVAISIDRFIAVTQPIKYSKHKNNKRVFLTIAILWLVSAAIGSPIVLGLNTSPERIPNLCVFYNSDFIIYSSLSSFYIPCIVMVYLYYKIFSAIHERAKKAIGKNVPMTAVKKESCREQLVSGNAPQLQEHSAVISEKQKYVTNLSALHEGDETNHFELADNGDDRSTVIVETTTTNEVFKPTLRQNLKTAHFNLEVTNCHASTEIAPKSNGTPNSSLAQDLKNIPADYEDRNERTEEEEVLKPKKMLKFCFVKQKKNGKKREKNAARRERKATKTLAIVLGVFLVCWVPFFTCNILDAICIKLQSDYCRPGVTAFLLTTWLGYVNSCVNPVIYTIFNMEFRKAFKKLLLGTCN